MDKKNALRERLKVISRRVITGSLCDMRDNWAEYYEELQKAIDTDSLHQVSIRYPELTDIVSELCQTNDTK